VKGTHRRSPPSLNGEQERCPNHEPNPLHRVEVCLSGRSETAGRRAFALTCREVYPTY
jgi:hypothetical protein